MNAMNDRDPVFVFAGYPREMAHFEDANAGLMRRIGARFIFPDYTADEIATVFVNFKAPPFELEVGLNIRRVAEVIDALTSKEHVRCFTQQLFAVSV